MNIIFFSGSYQNVAAPNLQLFKYSVLLAIKGVANVSSVRIANMQVQIIIIYFGLWQETH